MTVLAVAVALLAIAIVVALARFLTRFATAGEQALYGTTDPVEIERIRAKASLSRPR